MYNFITIYKNIYFESVKETFPTDVSPTDVSLTHPKHMFDSKPP